MFRLFGRPARSVLILPPDPGTVIGSRGDEAMLVSLIDELRRDSAAEIIVMGRRDAAVSFADKRRLERYSVWDSTTPPMDDFARLLDRVRPHSFIVVGADVMDGRYSAEFSGERFAMADAAARQRVLVTITGFSFSLSPDPSLREVIAGLDSRVAINLRDPVSFARWQEFTGRRDRLVSDLAFLLSPDKEASIDEATRSWILEQRDGGRRIIGFNAHPWLLPEYDEDASLRELCKSLAGIGEREKVSFLLIPHDYREFLGEVRYLSRLKEMSGHEARVWMLPGEPEAATLKALAGMCDGMIAGRMHLVIAALGMGIPVAGFGYQDKFEGLFQLLGLPTSLVAQLETLLQRHELEQFILIFLSQLDDLANIVRAKLPQMSEMARQNLTGHLR